MLEIGSEPQRKRSKFSLFFSENLPLNLRLRGGPLLMSPLSDNEIGLRRLVGTFFFLVFFFSAAVDSSIPSSRFSSKSDLVPRDSSMSNTFGFADPSTRFCLFFLRNFVPFGFDFERLTPGRLPDTVSLLRFCVWHSVNVLLSKFRF